MRLGLLSRGPADDHQTQVCTHPIEGGNWLYTCSDDPNQLKPLGDLRPGAADVCASSEFAGAAFDRIKLVPAEGIDLENLPAYLRNGAYGFGVGSPLFDKERVEAKEWHWVEEQARRFTAVH